MTMKNSDKDKLIEAIGEMRAACVDAFEDLGGLYVEISDLETVRVMKEKAWSQAFPTHKERLNKLAANLAKLTK